MWLAVLIDSFGHPLGPAFDILNGGVILLRLLKVTVRADDKHETLGTVAREAKTANAVLDPQVANNTDVEALHKKVDARRSFGERVVFLYVPFFLTITMTFGSTSEDPFITLRYAANLVHGYGLSFNRGQHVQGFTSPLHLLVAVVAYFIPGGHDLLVLKLASLVFGVLAIREAARLIQGISLARWARRTAYLLVATSWSIAFASGNGLETTLVVWLLVSIARRLVMGEFSISLAVFAFAAVLARFDTLAPILCMAAAGIVIEHSVAIWHRVEWVGGAALAAVMTLVGAFIYFGTALPNTYYAKDMAPGRALWMGADYLISSMQPAAWVSHSVGHWDSMAVLLFQVLMLVAGIYAIFRRYPRCGYLLALVIGQVIFILKSGGDWMIGGRFVAPAAIPFVVIQVLGLVQTASFLRHHLSNLLARSVLALGVAALLIGSILPLGSVRGPVTDISGLDDLSLLASTHDLDSGVWTGLANDLRCLHAGQMVAASEVGYLGFVRQDLRILDLRGLTNSAIATSAPAAMKMTWGVQDLTWYLPSSPVGRVLLKEKPAVIATFDYVYLPIRSALDGQYHVVEVRRLGYVPVVFYVRTPSTQVCPR